VALSIFPITRACGKKVTPAMACCSDSRNDNPAIFLLGQRMTLLMVSLITFVYSAYVMFLIFGIISTYERVALLAANAGSSEMMQSPLSMFPYAEGY
jgi:hypothetical protein